MAHIQHKADPAVRALQVDEVFRFADTAAAFSFLGALLTLGVLADTGDIGRGSVWFVFACGVTLVRIMAVVGYQRREPRQSVEPWARLIIAAIYCIANLIVDLLYPLVDPRVRLG